MQAQGRINQSGIKKFQVSVFGIQRVKSKQKDKNKKQKNKNKNKWNQRDKNKNQSENNFLII